MLTASVLVSSIDPSPAAASPSPSPAATATAMASPSSTKHSLTLAIPPGWTRTESGRFNEWRSPDGTSNFRVAPMAVAPQLQGPGAADAVKQMFEKNAHLVNPQAHITVVTIKVCNGEQTAYRVNDPLGMGTPGYMVLIPGNVSTGLINYEAHGSADPQIEQVIEKICWP